MSKHHKDWQEPDRFESVDRSKRVGVHRTSPKIGSAWMRVFMAVLAVVLLTALGILLIKMQPGSVKYSETAAEQTAPEPKKIVVGVLDPEATVVVLNGTEIEDLAYFVDDMITAEAWGEILFSGDATAKDIRTSAIFFHDPSDEAAAVALGEKLGGIKAYQNSDYNSWGNRLTVLLGADYSGPGMQEAQSGVHPRQGEGMSLTPEDEIFEEEYFEEESVEG